MKWAIQIVKEIAESAVFIPGKRATEEILPSQLVLLFEKKRMKGNVCKNDTDSTKTVATILI